LTVPLVDYSIQEGKQNDSVLGTERKKDSKQSFFFFLTQPGNHLTAKTNRQVDRFASALRIASTLI